MSWQGRFSTEKDPFLGAMHSDDEINAYRRMSCYGRVARIVGDMEGGHPPPPLFVELSTLTGSTWRERARWVAFEETVDFEANRWSKPHVPTPAVHNLFTLNKSIKGGQIMFDPPDIPTFDQLADTIATQLEKENLLAEDHSRDEVMLLLLANKTHQYQYAKGLKIEEGKSSSKTLTSSPSKASMGAAAESPDAATTPTKSGGENQQMQRKLTDDAEGACLLVAVTEHVKQSTFVLVRLHDTHEFADILEVHVPLRYLALWLCANDADAVKAVREAEAMGATMCDVVTRHILAVAKKPSDITDAIDDYMHQGHVLPVSHWDGNGRVAPPEEKATSRIAQLGQLFKRGRRESQLSNEDEAEEKSGGGGHGEDPALATTGRLFGGLVNDIKRRAPWYLSDFTDALNVQCLATFAFMYFALLAPIVTFGGLLEESTGRNMAALENIVSGAICGTLFSLFAGQPLTIICPTGPVLIFEQIIYTMCQSLDIHYLSFRLWVNVWTACILLILVATDASAMVKYITRFTEEAFATLVAVLFIKEALQKLWDLSQEENYIVYNVDDPGATCQCKINNRTDLSVSINSCREMEGGELFGRGCYRMWDTFLMSALLMFGTFIIICGLKHLRKSSFGQTKVRALISDFAVFIAIVVMVCFDLLIGISTPKLNVPSEFRPTNPDRTWLVPIFENPMWTVPFAALPALLGVILYFMDQQITAVIVNRKDNKLKKGAGYHLDLFVLSILTLFVGLFGLPIYVAATVMSVNHVNALKVQSLARAPGEMPTFVATIEQRVTGALSFIAVGLAIFMTNVLRLIPMPVLYGVFMYMGVSALDGIQLIDRIFLLLMPGKHQPDHAYLRKVPIRTVHWFTLCQLICLGLLWSIKSVKMTAMAFPVMLVIMVAVRKVIELFFTEEALENLDDKMPAIGCSSCCSKSKKEDIESTSDLPMPVGNKLNGDGRYTDTPMEMGDVKFWRRPKYCYR